MIRRTTWIVLAIFFLVLASMFYLLKAPSSPLVPTPAPSPTGYPKLVDLPAQNIEQIALKNGPEETLHLTRNPDGGWTMAPAGEKPVIKGQVLWLIAEVTNLHVFSPANPSLKLSDVGLDDKSGKSILITSMGGVETIIHVGDLSPTSENYFASLNKQLPVLINKGSIDTVFTNFSAASLTTLQPTRTPPPSSNAP